jgi:hypothetical protein
MRFQVPDYRCRRITHQQRAAAGVSDAISRPGARAAPIELTLSRYSDSPDGMPVIFAIELRLRHVTIRRMELKQFYSHATLVPDGTHLPPRPTEED